MTEEARKASEIEKFDGTDFGIWRMQIEDHLYGRKLHLPLLGEKPEAMKAEEWAFLDRQVLGVIRLTLSRSIAHNVVKKKTTADLMKALSGMYEKPSVNNKVHLMKKLFNLKMAENASVAQHLNKFNTITNQLSSVEIDFDDEIRALIVLAFLPNNWEAIRMAVSNSTGKEKLKYNDIQDLILAEEIRKRDVGETSGSGSALNLETRGRRVSFHTTPHQEIIQNYVAGDFGKVYLVDGSALDVVGMRDVRILLPNGSVWLLEKVRHIPDLRRNLISVGQLDNEGHAILFVGSTWKVTKRARVLARGKKTGKQKNVSFLKTGRTPKAEKLELVHTDLWGPSPVASLGGSKYYITFIDDSSRKGIRMEKTIPGTPQQNGVAERMNRTLNERARSMRLHAGLPKTFWADTVSTAANLINRRPSVPMEFRLPKDVWSGKEVMYKNRSTVVSDVTEIDQKKSEFVNLDELTEGNVQKVGEEDKENVNLQVDLSTLVAEVRRSPRNIRPPQHYSPTLNYLLLTDGGKSECYDEALQDKNSSKWELAMKDEMDSLLGNQTWELTELPVGKKALHVQNEHDGSKRYNVRLVVKGFQQKEGIDYTEIFSPVVKMSTIRLVLGMVAAENLHLEQLDMKTAFLHGSSIEEINNLKKQLSKQFAMKDLGATKQIFGMRIIRDKANEEERDHMSKVPYASVIGSLMYVMVCTRPDIAHAVGVVSRFISRPGKQHWETIKWILRYLKGSSDTCFWFTGASLKLQGYVDADFAGDIDSRKSNTGFVFTLGGTAISWASNLQKIVTLSTIEVEYVAATEAGKEMI
uniref:Integrase catalytic domain-containing protein n=1 Tax=Quercus lobata TaxID=97700 RepID=A0A7N2QZR7_QUELO